MNKYLLRLRQLRLGGSALTLLAGLALASCGAATEAGPIGDATRGQRVFRGTETLQADRLEACIDCHSDVVGGESYIAHNLSNIGNRAATTVEGQPPISYLRTAILAPDAYLAAGFQEGIMPRTYAELLTEQDINDLIAYMLTLKSGQDE